MGEGGVKGGKARTREPQPALDLRCEGVREKKKKKKESVVMADGAKCYFQVRDTLGCRLHQVPHCKNIYNRRTSTKRLVNTGSLDLVWRRLKDIRPGCQYRHLTPTPALHSWGGGGGFNTGESDQQKKQNKKKILTHAKTKKKPTKPKKKRGGAPLPRVVVRLTTARPPAGGAPFGLQCSQSGRPGSPRDLGAKLVLAT